MSTWWGKWTLEAKKLRQSLYEKHGSRTLPKPTPNVRIISSPPSTPYTVHRIPYTGSPTHFFDVKPQFHAPTCYTAWRHEKPMKIPFFKASSSPTPSPPLPMVHDGTAPCHKKPTKNTKPLSAAPFPFDTPSCFPSPKWRSQPKASQTRIPDQNRSA